MATKKQKREAALARRAEFEESIRQEGLAAQRADREERERRQREQKIQDSKELLAKHEREKQARRDISDAQREHQEFLDRRTPGQILATYALIGAWTTESEDSAEKI